MPKDLCFDESHRRDRSIGMFAIFFVAGIIVAGALAYNGLVRGQLQFSKTQTLRGRSAKIAGFACLALCVALLGAIVVSLLMIK
jgi:hypothetical protein